MAVERDVLEVEFFLVVLVDKGGFQFPFAAGTEALDLDLLGKIEVVYGEKLEDRFLGAPVDGELLVALVVLEVFDLLFGQGPFFHGGEIAVQGFDVDAHVFFFMENHGYIPVRVGNGDVDRIVFDIRLAVVMVAEIDFFVEHGAQQGPHGEPLLAQGFAADERDFLHLVGGGGTEFFQFFLGLTDLPDADQRIIVKFLFKIKCHCEFC